MRGVGLVVLAGVALMAYACGSGSSPGSTASSGSLATTLQAIRTPDADQVALLERNRDKWASSGITDYRYAVKVICFCPSYGTFTVVVRDGRLASITDSAGAVLSSGLTYDSVAYISTADDMFRSIEAGLPAFSRFEVTYQENGFPRRIDSYWRTGATDGDWIVEVTDFQVLQ